MRRQPRVALYRKRDQHPASLQLQNGAHYVKDGINDYIVHGKQRAINPEQKGTKAAANYKLTVAPGATAITRLRLTNHQLDKRQAFRDLDKAG